MHALKQHATELVRLLKEAERPGAIAAADDVKAALFARREALAPLRRFLNSLTDSQLKQLVGLMFFGRDCRNGDSEDLDATTETVWQGRADAYLAFETKTAHNLESYFTTAFKNLRKNS